MNNWKLRSTITGQDGMDFVEVNGHLASYDQGEDVLCYVEPYGDKYAAPIRTSASDDFGPVSNQVPGITNGTFTLAGGGSNINRPATTITGQGSGAQFNYGFLADGALSYIQATSGGSGYKVGDKLSITTTSGHGSQVIEFRLVDGSNAVRLTARLIHDQGVLPYAVKRVRITETDEDHTIQVLDYRSQQVFPRPQDKLLDRFPDAAAAYGLRLLRSAYLGPAIRVSRSSDSAEKDIYFDSQGNLDTATLQAHVGASLGRVKTWYDQSGNGNDASQSATSQRPPITSASGELITVNGKPAMNFDGSNDSFDMSHDDLYGQDVLDAYMHLQSNGTEHILFRGQTSGTHSFVIDSDGTSTTLSGQYGSPDLYVNGVKIAITSGTTTRADLHDAVVTNGTSHSNGAIVLHQGADTNAATAWTSFEFSRYGNFYFDGKLTEMVLYNTDQSANRENIEKDMALHSGAYQVEDAPLLDAYGGAHAAYSLRKLNSDYTGAAIRVVSVTGSQPYAEQDIGFDANGNLDEAALTAFAQNNANIKTWYDQSGNGNHVTPSSLNQMPKIMYSNGNVVKVGQAPAALFSGSQALPFDSTGLDIGNLSSFSVMKYTDTSGSEMGLSLSGTASNKRWYAPYAVATNFAYGYGATPTGITTPANTANNLHSMIAGATQGDMEAFLNGTSVGTQALVSGIDAGSTGIGNQNDNFHMNGFIQEVVVYSSDQSERRLGIERNISNHYDL